MDGPDVRVGPKAALSFALALHELGTNAVKYGALSTPNGRVEITWRSLPDAIHAFSSPGQRLAAPRSHLPAARVSGAG